MLMLDEQRSSLQVAPLSINKSRTDSPSANGLANGDQNLPANLYSPSQMTPPATPNGSAEDLGRAPSPPPVFHSFLRAFYPFHPSYAMSDSAVTLPLNEGDIVLIHSIHTNGWADGTLLVSGSRGWLPTNYCDAYDPEEMGNLLKALLNFWDLLRSTAVNDSEIFGNQEFMKGMIAGVRYLLERTNCLTRESAIIQKHDLLRRGRKSLLSELSSLVKTAKRLQEAQKLASPVDYINDIIDEMILKAFRIVTKGVRFLDILEEDRRLRAPQVTVMATVLEESYTPATPPADTTSFDHSQTQGGRDSSGTENYTLTSGRTPTPESGSLHPSLTKRVSSLQYADANSNRVSYGGTSHRPSSGISHRVSLVGPSPSSSSPQNLVSQRLSDSHDTFLSYLGSFIGRLHLQSQARPHLARAIKQSAASGGELLVVVDVVCGYSSLSSDVLDQPRAAMYDRIQDLVVAARDILTRVDPDVEDVILPQDNTRLLYAATGCVKATGECVAKTKWVIERVGDFEFEFDEANVGIDLDLSALDFPEESQRNGSVASSAATTTAESHDWSTAPEPGSTEDPDQTPVRQRPASLSIDKPLPAVPEIVSPTEASSVSTYSPTASRPQSMIIDENASTLISSTGSMRPSLPPLPKLSTSMMPKDDFVNSPSEASVDHESVFHSSFGSESMTATSSGTTSSYLSRDSELTLVSQTSTRATTPDHLQAPRNQPSMGELSTTDSSTLAEETDDVESRLLEKTYAHELMYNKEGQVTGGTLPALVERLTTHESTPDATFVSTFFLTFRLFSTSTQLAEALIDRFDYVGEAPHVAGPVRLRVYNVLKGWLESHWRDDHDHEALCIIENFAEIKLNPVLPSAAKRLLELTQKVTATDGTLVPRLVSSMGKTNTAISLSVSADTPLPPATVSKTQMSLLTGWKNGSTCPTIMDFEPVEIARQLTIRQMNTFCSISPEELLGSKWMKKQGMGSPHVKAMSSFSTDLSNLVADTILAYTEPKKRAACIKQWIKIAQHCLELKNYDVLMAVICTLNSSTIARLRKTWELISSKRREMFKTMQAIVEPSQNNKVLRNRLHDHVPPCLPFLGSFLTDLTFVDNGNPATKNLPGHDGSEQGGLTVINFDKHMKTAKVIGELQRFQIPYRLTEVPEMQEWLQTLVVKVREVDTKSSNVQVYWRKSLLLEPRETQALKTAVEGGSLAAPLNNHNGGGGGGGVFSWMRGNTGQ